MCLWKKSRSIFLPSRRVLLDKVPENIDPLLGSCALIDTALFIVVPPIEAGTD